MHHHITEYKRWEALAHKNNYRVETDARNEHIRHAYLDSNQQNADVGVFNMTDNNGYLELYSEDLASDHTTVAGTNGQNMPNPTGQPYNSANPVPTDAETTNKLAEGKTAKYQGQPQMTQGNPRPAPTDLSRPLNELKRRPKGNA